MVNKISELVTGEAVITWLIIAFLFFYFIYKEAPEFKKRVSSNSIKEYTTSIVNSKMDERLSSIETSLKEINDKLNSDYSRINTLEDQFEKSMVLQKESLKEREIIMRSLIAALEGLQELGADGIVKSTLKDIKDYLNTQAHKGGEESD